MQSILGNIWALGLIAFVCKSFADLYMSYFKWVQALEAKRARRLVHNIEQKVVSLISHKNTPILLAIGCISIVVLSLLLRQELRFPFLTLFNLMVSTGISVVGCFGDLSRASLK